MWQGLKKAVTFSFDDGVLQDIRFVELLNKYNLKGTFNLNSGLLVKNHPPLQENVRNKISEEDVQALYKGHEVAVHTLTHPRLHQLTNEQIVQEILQDKEKLETLCGYEVVGMAYPYGLNEDKQRIVDVIARHTPIRYARTTVATYSFAEQTDLLSFHPTAHFKDARIWELAEQFLADNSTERKLFYIWGHTYELDYEQGDWERFEEFCKYISNRADVFYATNKEALHLDK